MKQTLSIAFGAIRANKLRSFLTILGIIIGVMSVVTLVSIGNGTSKSITNSISSMGSNLLTASVSSEDVSVTRDDLKELESYSDVSAVAPVLTSSQTVKSGSTTYDTNIIGVTTSYAKVQDISVQSGRLIKSSDLTWRTNVAVIGTEVATEVFETWDVIGKTLTFGERTFQIVGLLEESGSSTHGSNDNRILIPYTTAERVMGEKNVTQFYVSAKNADVVNRVENLITMFLMRLIKDEDGFQVYNQSEVLDTMDEVNNTMTMMLAGIAAISLIVGGIGIMNIMLVSVTERTREIGIRKAIGAQKSNILGQFLVEACILSSLGGLFGILGSFAGIMVYNYVTGAAIAIAWGTVGATIIFCAVIGIVFGSYPALKAARLLPVQALRYS